MPGRSPVTRSCGTGEVDLRSATLDRRGICGIKWGHPEVPDEMVDPTSDLGENVSEDDAPRCATCGDPIVGSPDHRVTTRIEDDSVETIHFCDDDCREGWTAATVETN